jgi:hypothetical protein
VKSVALWSTKKKGTIKGYGSAAIITEADMKKLYTSKTLDINTAQGLQYKVFIDIMFYTCRRCRENPVYFGIIKQLITA